MNAAPSAGRATARLVLLAVACLLAFALVYVVAVRTGWGQRVDDTALAGRVVQRPRLRAASRDLLSTIDISSLAFLGGALVLIALARGGLRLASVPVLVVGTSVLAAETLKHVVLTRPDLLGSQLPIPFNSYPSGHTTVAMSLGLAATLVASARSRTWVAVAGTAYGVAVGIGTIAAGWHRPSDVIGALLLVTAVAALVAAWLLAPPASPTSRAGRVASGAMVVTGALGCGVGFLALLGTVLALRADSINLVRLDAAFVGAAAACAGVGLVCTGALLAATGPRDAPASAVPSGDAGRVRSTMV